MKFTKLIVTFFASVFLISQVQIADAKSFGSFSSSKSSSSSSSSKSSSFSSSSKSSSFSSSSKSSSTPSKSSSFSSSSKSSSTPSKSSSGFGSFGSSKPAPSSPSISKSSTPSPSSAATVAPAKSSGGWGLFSSSKSTTTPVAPVVQSQTAKEMTASTQKANTAALYKNVAIGATAGAVAGTVVSNNTTTSTTKPTPNTIAKPTTNAGTGAVIASGTNNYRREYNTTQPSTVIVNQTQYVPVPVIVGNNSHRYDDDYVSRPSTSTTNSSSTALLPANAVMAQTQISGYGWIWFFVIITVIGGVGYVMLSRMNRPSAAPVIKTKYQI